MTNTPYHYTECGLDNIYLVNGFRFIETPRGKSVSINDVDGLHKAIGLCLVKSQKDFSGEEVCFLRHEMLMSQRTLANLLGISEQAIRRWENGQTQIPKPSESLLRLLYQEHVNDQSGRIASTLRRIANLEEKINDEHHLLCFKDTENGWQTVQTAA